MLFKITKIPKLSIPNLSFSFVTSKSPPPPPLHICTVLLCMYIHTYNTTQPGNPPKPQHRRSEAGQRERKKLKFKQGKKKTLHGLSYQPGKKKKKKKVLTAIAQIRSERKQCKSRISPSAETWRVLFHFSSWLYWVVVAYYHTVTRNHIAERKKKKAKV